MTDGTAEGGLPQAEQAPTEVARGTTPAPAPRHENKLPRVAAEHVTKHGRTMLIDALAGTSATLLTALFGLILVQFGVAQQSRQPGQSFAMPELKLFKPDEFWKSISGLIVEWSQANEWVLFGLGLTSLAGTVMAFVFWQRMRRVAPEEPDGDHRRKRLLVAVAEEQFVTLKTVASFAMLTGLLVGAYCYQQYLWRIALPVPKGEIGIAFTRQLQGSIARTRLADDLQQMGHAGQVALRDLPITFDAADTAKARALARRIGADAVVIYQDEPASGSARQAASRGPGLAAPLADAVVAKHVAYLVFADPSIGVQVPVAQRDGSGQTTAIGYRAKEGVDVPRLEAADVDRVMEAAAGILLYDKDRYLPAIAHLQDALSPSGSRSPSDAIVELYLGHTYFVLGQDASAESAYGQAISLLESEQPLSVQDRLMLAGAYVQQATLLFDGRQVDQAEALLKKAVALRAPLDEDQTALRDPTTFQRLHSTYGAVYVALLDIAHYRRNNDDATLWSSRAQDEAKALLTQPDHAAQETAIWLQYRTGDCVSAARSIYALLDKNPGDLAAHQLAERLAYLSNKDQIPTNIPEVDRQLAAILRLDPQNLPELQAQQVYQSLAASLDDPGYLPQEQKTVDSILAVDPHNAGALRGYVGDAIDTIPWPFIAKPGDVLWSAEYGDSRTFQQQQAAWSKDPARIQAVLDQLNAVRPYATRWAEEVQPDSATPLLYRARLSQRAESLVYQLQYMPGTTKLPSIASQYDTLWKRAEDDTLQVLNGRRTATPQEQEEAHVLLSQLAGDHFWVLMATKSPVAAGAAADSLAQAQRAAALVAAHAPTTPEETDAAATVYLNLFNSLITAKVPAAAIGDKGQLAQDTSLASVARARWLALAQQAQSQRSEDAAYQGGVTCSSTQSRQQGDAALQKGDVAGAVRLLKQYIANFPRDPAGMLDLGWAEYRAGDLTAALTSTQQFEQAVPGSFLGPSNRGIILLAQGNSAEAQRAYMTALQALQAEPEASRLTHFGAMAGDLLALARDNPAARPAVKTVLPALADYLAGLPAATGMSAGSILLADDNKVGGIAFWAGDYATAGQFYDAALAISPTSALEWTNRGLTKLVTGDTAGAQAAYQQAIAVAKTYLNDPSGQPLAGTDRAAAVADLTEQLASAGNALHVLVAQRPELQQQGSALVAVLAKASAQMK
jgi:Flp pilus assembly protein TadD